MSRLCLCASAFRPIIKLASLLFDFHLVYLLFSTNQTRHLLSSFSFSHPSIEPHRAGKAIKSWAGGWLAGRASTFHFPPSCLACTLVALKLDAIRIHPGQTRQPNLHILVDERFSPCPCTSYHSSYSHVQKPLTFPQRTVLLFSSLSSILFRSCCPTYLYGISTLV